MFRGQGLGLGNGAGLKEEGSDACKAGDGSFSSILKTSL
jgi:hypothetical protein